MNAIVGESVPLPVGAIGEALPAGGAREGLLARVGADVVQGQPAPGSLVGAQGAQVDLEVGPSPSMQQVSPVLLVWNTEALATQSKGFLF